MAEGILAYPGDGGPAIVLSAGGMTVPSYVGSYGPNKGVTADDNGTQHCTIGAIAAGATPFIIPRKVLSISLASTALFPSVMNIKGVSISGRNVSASTNVGHSIQAHKQVFFEFDAFQIMPRTNMSYGINIQNTQNWLEVTDAASIGYCIWKGTVNNVKSWTPPTIKRWDSTTANYDKARYVVFAHWDNNTFTLDWDGTTLTAHSNVRGGDTQQVNITNVQIAIFITGYPAQPHNGGLTIYNAKGTCTFSTARAPFMYKGMITTSANPTAAPAGVSKMMVPLCRLGVRGESGGGWSTIMIAGMRMSGNKLWAATGNNAGMNYKYTDHYAPPNDYTISIQLPVIDAANYF